MTAGQTLAELVKKLGSKKGLEKNLCAKRYIKKIQYSPEEISITLYLKRAFTEQELYLRARGRVGATSCLSSSSDQKKSLRVNPEGSRMVGREGFEPSKAEPTDLQSVAFDRFAISPLYGAGERSRTPDQMITNQLLYQLSYTGEWYH
jgi:hypothetical protein